MGGKEEETIKEEETGGTGEAKSKFVGGKYGEGDESKGEEKRGTVEGGKNGEAEGEGEEEERMDEEEENRTEDGRGDMEVGDEDKEEDGERQGGGWERNDVGGWSTKAWGRFDNVLVCGTDCWTD